jgi:hypothetical protein
MSLASMSQQQTQELRHLNQGGQANASTSYGSDATDSDRANPMPSVLPSPPGSAVFWKQVAAQRCQMKDEPEDYDEPIRLKSPAAQTDDLITLNESEDAGTSS